eukprot:2048762-Rhodomonas_salina.1
MYHSLKDVRAECRNISVAQVKFSASLRARARPQQHVAGSVKRTPRAAAHHSTESFPGTSAHFFQNQTSIVGGTVTCRNSPA